MDWFGQTLPAPPLGGAFFEPADPSKTSARGLAPSSSAQGGHLDRDFWGFARRR